MARKAMLFAAITALMGGCGSGDEPAELPSERAERAPRRETVFDPMTSTIGRAQGVQQTLDDGAAEQRRRIEDAER
jgi:hypothetical protein